MEWVARLFKFRHVSEGNHEVEVGTAVLEDFTLTCSSKTSLCCLHTGPLATWDTVPYTHVGTAMRVYRKQFLSLCLLLSAKARFMYKRELATQKPGDQCGWLDGFCRSAVVFFFFLAELTLPGLLAISEGITIFP